MDLFFKLVHFFFFSNLKIIDFVSTVNYMYMCTVNQSPHPLCVDERDEWRQQSAGYRRYRTVSGAEEAQR